MRVLIVDDEEMLRQRISRAIEGFGHEAVSADDGKAAWHMATTAKVPFDLILTDLKMPKMDGQELLSRAHELGLESPIAVMTGHGDLDAAIAALRLGAIDFLTKPFGLDQIEGLLERMETLSEGSRITTGPWPFEKDRLTLSIPSTLEAAKNCSQRIVNHLRPLLFRYEVNTRSFGLCVSEALMNAVIHGNLEVSSSLREESQSSYNAAIKSRQSTARFGERKVDIEVEASDMEIMLTIRDEGSGFNFAALPAVDSPLSMLASGRGLILIRSTMNEVRWNERGNEITLIIQNKVMFS